VCRIIKAEFGVMHTPGGIYEVLRRLGYSSLVRRPRHPAFYFPNNRRAQPFYP